MVIKVKTEPNAKSKVIKPKAPKARTTNKVANTPTKTKSPRKKATQDENANPAAPTAQPKAKQFKKKVTAIDGMEAPADGPDHAALLARIRELEGEFAVLPTGEFTKLTVHTTHHRACAGAQ